MNPFPEKTEFSNSFMFVGGFASFRVAFGAHQKGFEGRGLMLDLSRSVSAAIGYLASTIIVGTGSYSSSDILIST
jgi:hypothetical protein